MVRSGMQRRSSSSIYENLDKEAFRKTLKGVTVCSEMAQVGFSKMLQNQ